MEGKVVQRVIKYIGKEIGGEVCRRVNTKDVRVEAVKRYADVLMIDKIAKILELEGLFKKEEGKYILAFVYSHLLERPSIRKLEGWFYDTEIPIILGLQDISTMKLYETLRELSEMDFSNVEEKIFLKLNLYERDKFSVIIDVTDTYFEGNTVDEEPRRGKDGKYRRLIQIGLGVTEKHGFPIMMKTYPGNISNLMIFKDLFVNLSQRGFKALIINRGMGSEENIKEVLSAQMEIITGLKKTKGLQRKYLEKIKREDIYSPENRISLKNTSVYIKKFPYLEGKLIAVYNPHLEVIRSVSLANKIPTFWPLEFPT